MGCNSSSNANVKEQEQYPSQTAKQTAEVKPRPINTVAETAPPSPVKSSKQGNDQSLVTTGKPVSVANSEPSVAENKEVSETPQKEEVSPTASGKITPAKDPVQAKPMPSKTEGDKKAVIEKSKGGGEDGDEEEDEGEENDKQGDDKEDDKEGDKEKGIGAEEGGTAAGETGDDTDPTADDGNKPDSGAQLDSAPADSAHANAELVAAGEKTSKSDEREQADVQTMEANDG